MAPLQDACRDGDTERVKQLLDGEGGAQVDGKDWNMSRTALMWASLNGHTEVAKLLLDKGALLDENSWTGGTALMLAINKGHTEVAKLLVDKGALLDERSRYDGSTALRKASENGHTEVVKLLLDKGALLDEKGVYGFTALMWAIHRGHTEVVRLLLDKGALLDEKDEEGRTALLLAINKYGHTEVAKLLLDKGALLDEKDKWGRTALVLAIEKGHTEVAKLLVDKGALLDEKDVNGNTALLLAIKYGHTEVAKLLLDKGALLDEKSSSGSTALMLAINKGHTEVAKLLLDKGALLDEKDADGRTALVLATEKGHTEVAELLVDKGALLDEKSSSGSTALLLASVKGHTELVRLLLDKGALLDDKGRSGNTALMWASNKGHTEVAKLLVDKGALLDEKSRTGGTALMLAIDNGHTEVAKLLVDKGALLDEKDENGGTALMVAIDKGHTEVAWLLLNKGASVHEKSKAGDTALVLASYRGHTELARLLLDRGTSVGVKSSGGNTALPTVVAFDEDQLGRMAAAQVQRYSLQLPGQVDDNLPAATAKAVLQLVRLAGFARDRARNLRSSDPRSADDHQTLFGRLQLAAAACVRNDESGKARDEVAVQELFRSNDGRTALEHAVQIEAKELLAQPVVQGYIEVAWWGDYNLRNWSVIGALVALLWQLLFALPVLALVPSSYGHWGTCCNFGLLLRLPVVKFGLECSADLALALALTLLPAADLATAPVAPLLLIWVGSGLLWEGRQLISAGSDAPPGSRSLLEIATSVPDRLAAYWADHINRVDATALIFSFVALVAFVSAGDGGDPTATSLRVVAVFLLWLRTIRVLLVSPKFGPFVMMFFRMLFGDVLYFLVLLLVLLVAFAASWTVLLEPQSSLIAGCADDLGGDDFSSTILRLLESALTGDDYFECARDSTNSPVAAWVITFGYVTLTAVLLLNMLIAMMAKTFDNISEASATNYLFLFAQRTLALQNELPTPPPLNALGLPCHVICLLWDLLQKKTDENVLEATATEAIAFEKACSSVGSWSFSTGSWSFAGSMAAQGDEKLPIEGEAMLEERAAAEAAAEETQSSATQEKTFAENIQPLAEKVTEYILDHQDDAAQEDRWRTTMKRDIGKSFRIQNKKIDKQGIAMQQMHAKMDKTIQLVKDLALPAPSVSVPISERRSVSVEV